MAEQYPCKLPGVLVNSNGYSPQDTVDRNDLSSGPPIFRLRSDDGWLLFDVAWSYSALENQVFRLWHQNTLARGSKSFTIELMVDGWNGESQTLEHECYFSGVPSFRQNGRRWNVSATLLAIRSVGLDECDTDSLISAFNGFDDLNQAIIQMDDVNQTLEDLWAP